jgi:cellulose synthase/poly-beta-1,6-N-acetylglucosamine synthase-like glycosyltransferase
MARILPFAPVAAEPAQDAPSAARRPLLGDVLVRAGAIDPERLAEALDQQRHQDQRLGRILVANRLISGEDLGAALSTQSGLGRIDLRKTPADPELVATIDPYRCLELEALPWRQVGGTRVIAISSPEAAAAAMEACGGGAEKLAFALAEPEDVRSAITGAFAGRLRDDARDRCPAAFSCRTWTERLRRRRVAAAALAGVAAVAAFPLLALQLLMGWIVVANAATTALRLVALFARFRVGPVRPQHDAPRLADYKKLPQVSILVPLLREEAVAQRLLEALAAMDYPPALLDIKLVLEAEDAITRAAIERAELPPTIEVVTVPPDGLKTKPRAMNYALPFCRGDIVGVYDAEDRPDPGQIRAVVQHLADAPPEVACVQGYLDFYNSGRNWLSRCFTLEYAIWFRVVLHGVQRLGIPIPLGGTTVFFRRNVLEKIGAWDAHNVTEDADLGMRLARFGYRCEMLSSTTWEEANCRVLSWIRQRSRWLKGYAITWATHMRRPGELWRDLGPRGFLGFQVLFLGAITSYLALPLFWVIWTSAAGFGLAFWSTFPSWLMLSFLGSMVAGQAVMLAAAVIAARDAGRPGLVRWVLALPFYWPLGAVAAYRAIGEIFSRPSYWHKTEHGFDAT